MTVRLLLAIATLALATACGAAEEPGGPVTGPEAAVADYGIEASFPAGWHGRVRRGAVHAATFPLPPEGRAFTRAASARVREADDAVVLLFENEAGAGSPGELAMFEELSGPPRLVPEDFQASDGLTDDSAQSGHGFARRLFRLAGRSFVLFVETGSRRPPPPVLDGLNELLASLRVAPGDFYPGFVEPARFAERPGWHAGTSGAAERRADSEWTTSWAATIPYADEWNALPPQRTLERLPEDGIVVWASLSRNNRFPPQPGGDETFPAREPPFRPADFEHHPAWEGQVRGLPEHRLSATVRGQYQLELRIWFGRPDPTAAMLAEAQAMVDGLTLPDWGPWDVETPAVGAHTLARHGVSLRVPRAWDGRILFTDAAGAGQVLFQIASFRLPPNDGLEPPEELPPGAEDPTKAMGRGDVLVTVTTEAPGGIPTDGPIGFDDLRVRAAGDPRVPHGHTLAEGTFCYAARCVRVEADFGGNPPPAHRIRHVDAALRGLSVGPRG